MAKIKMPASRAGKVLVGIGALLTLCICGFFGAVALVAITGDDSPTPVAVAARLEATVAATNTVAPSPTTAPSATSEPTRTPAPTATPAPTRTPPPSPTLAPSATPEPSATPAPTATPEPSATPAPTATPEPAGFSDVEQSYVVAVLAASQQMSDGLTALGEQSMEASADPTVVLTIDWKVDTSLAIQDVREAANTFQELDAPLRFAPVQAELLIAAERFLTSMDLYTEGIDELDADKLQLASEAMDEGREAVERATTEIERIASDTQ